MNKKNIYQLSLIILVVVFLASMPFWYKVEKKTKSLKKLDWNPTFKKTETKPYASLALYVLLKDIFPEKKIIQRAKIAPKDTSLQRLGKKYNLFFVHNQMDNDAEYASSLYFFVSGGGEAFLATSEVPYHLSEMLENLSLGYHYTKENLSIQFTNTFLKDKKRAYTYKNISSHYYVNNFNKEEGVVLATDQYNYPILVKIPVGNGNFYICTIPLAFTNFSMLDSPNSEFIEKSLSYLPIRDVLWEDLPSWETRFKNKNTKPTGIKELAFLKKNESLWWAFLLSLFSIFLFILFRAKREQRTIPIAESYGNTSLEFAKTIGRLYFNFKDHKNLAEKKIIYLNEFIKNSLQINISDSYDENTIQKISQKAALPYQEVQELFTLIKEVKEKAQISDSELLMLSKQISNFKKKAK